MKNQWENENTDVLLFEYLEGNLSLEDASLIDDKLQIDQTLSEELSLWKETYLKSDFYDTSLLEKRILNPNTHSFNFTSWLNTFLFLGLVVVLSFKSENVGPGMSINATLRVDNFQMAGEDKERAESFGSQKVVEPEFRSIETFTEETQAARVVKVTRVNISPMESLDPVFFPIDKPEDLIEIKSMRVETKISEMKKKEKRRRSVYKRTRLEFGSGYYAVPLDTKNF